MAWSGVRSVVKCGKALSCSIDGPALRVALRELIGRCCAESVLDGEECCADGLAAHPQVQRIGDAPCGNGNSPRQISAFLGRHSRRGYRRCGANARVGFRRHVRCRRATDARSTRRSVRTRSVFHAGMELAPRITADPAVCHGQPVVAGTRVLVFVVVGSLAGGMSVEDVVREYDVTEEDVRASLRFAADLASR